MTEVGRLHFARAHTKQTSPALKNQADIITLFFAKTYILWKKTVCALFHLFLIQIYMCLDVTWAEIFENKKQDYGHSYVCFYI